MAGGPRARCGQPVIAVAPDVSDQVRARQRAERESVETGRSYQHARDVVSQLQQALPASAVPVLPRVDVAAGFMTTSPC